ncbi:MAG TPA: isochorismate synthase [Candidatus Binatia bacterium]|nr:isochorismate synthase [Candidatus Binatia bacterium]
MNTISAAGGATLSDLLEAWQPGDFLMECGGRGLLGKGVRFSIPVAPGPDQLLRAARLAEDEVARTAWDTGTPPEACMVVGALPFRGDVAAMLTVPARVHRSATATGPQPAMPGLSATPGLEEAASPVGDGPALHWRAEPATAEFRAAVVEAMRRIRSGDLEKVVLSRALVAGNPGIDGRRLLAALRRRDPGCHLFAAPAGTGTFLGATPETLVRRSGDRVVSVPHAGTAARSGDPDEDRNAGRALLHSPKDRHEHALVVDAVAAQLSPHCSDLRVDREPHLAGTAAVWHLATTVHGRLRQPALSSLALAAALHPTPAVCGTPREPAAALIAQLEPAGRGLYAGLVGWMDGRGDGEWAVSLRCALVTPEAVRLYAGVGIVAGSEPDAELAETDAKFRTLQAAIMGS